MKYDVVTLGSATIDYFADTDSELIRIETRTRKEELIAFPLGSKLLIKALAVMSGGGGTNTAVAFSRLGLKTGYLGKIGDDANGDLVLESLAAEQVDFVGVREGQTGLSFILDSIHDDRCILAFKGTNDHLHPQDMPSLDTECIYLSSMMGESFETVRDFLAGSHYKVAFNPSSYQAVKGYQGLKGIIDRVHILVMNREEACKFLGLNYEESPPVEALFRKMAELPPAIFIITDGAEGVHVYDREYYYRGLPAPHLKIVETTGAGDAFASTFTAMILRGQNIESAIHLAMTNAESVLSFKGAKEKLLSWEALQEAARTLTRILEKRPLESVVGIESPQCNSG